MPRCEIDTDEARTVMTMRRPVIVGVRGVERPGVAMGILRDGARFEARPHLTSASP